MKKTKTINIEVEVCDTCGDDLFQYGESGNPPRHVTGVFFSQDDKAYCERDCIPDE